MVRPSKKVLSVSILVFSLVISIMLMSNKKSPDELGKIISLTSGEKISVPNNSNWESELASIESPQNPIENSQITEISITDEISKDLIANYLSLKQSGDLDEETSNRLVEQTIDKISRVAPELKLLSQSDIQVTEDTGLRSAQDYGEQLGNSIKSSKPLVIKNEGEIVHKAITNKDQEILTELDSVIGTYKQMHQNLLSIKVPKLFVKAHLNMLNGTKAMYEGLESSKKVVADPITGLQGIQIYQAGLETYFQTLNLTRTLFKQNNIIYKQGTGGYYLLHGI